MTRRRYHPLVMERDGHPPEIVGEVEMTDDGWHGELYVDDEGWPCQLPQYADIEYFGPHHGPHETLDAVKRLVKRTWGRRPAERLRLQ